MRIHRERMNNPPLRYLNRLCIEDGLQHPSRMLWLVQRCYPRSTTPSVAAMSPPHRMLPGSSEQHTADIDADAADRSESTVVNPPRSDRRQGLA